MAGYHRDRGSISRAGGDYRQPQIGRRQRRAQFVSICLCLDKEYITAVVGVAPYHRAGLLNTLTVRAISLIFLLVCCWLEWFSSGSFLLVAALSALS